MIYDEIFMSRWNTRRSIFEYGRDSIKLDYVGRIHVKS